MKTCIGHFTSNEIQALIRTAFVLKIHTAFSQGLITGSGDGGIDKPGKSLDSLNAPQK